MLDKQTSIETAKSFVKDLKSYGYSPKEAWVFGSVISGRTHKWSDIDLALWDDKFSGVSFIDIEGFADLLLKYRLIEVRTYQSNATEDENPFIGEIKRTGERIL